MLARRLIRFVSLVGLGSYSLLNASPALAAPASRSIVIIDPRLGSDKEKISGEHVEAFARRLEVVMKWKPGSLRAQGFRNLEDAQDFLSKERPVLGILAPHPFVQLRKAKKVEILGYASGIETKNHRYNLLSRTGDNLSSVPHQNANLRLASEVKDMQWLNVIFDGTLNPVTHFQHVPVASEEEAVESVVAKRADAALVWAEHTNRYSKHLHPGNLRVSFHSAKFPPSTVVVFKQAAKPDLKAVKPLAKALPEVCKGTGNITICGALGFHFMAAGEHELHPHVIYKYENYK